ncbi:MAG: hypothetical protein EAZ76_08330 [Nostocales cyanobacterium]|nr:MAG: hypothetical protein EAZ87_14695 [Nostocales cyanobacterium]TAF15690.1 MAG: hypothetical protein EAZ76_08330 [Nostocales cyanobacterium]
MEHWQFLIQRQGDRSWQSLESANLKISPGKYRVLARSSLSPRDVEVRVIHSTIQEFPPKRRVFKRLRRIDANGLMAVIPFTDFKPGVWEIRCSGDLMSDMLGESWQYSLVINVSSSPSLPQLLLGGGDDTGANFQSSVIETEDYSDSTVTSISQIEDVDDTNTSVPSLEDHDIYEPVNPVLKGDTVEQIVQNLLDLALPASDSWDDEPSADTTPVLPLSLPIELCLEQDNYIAQWGKTLQINGEVISAQIENLTDEKLSTISIYQLQIVTELRSPVESNILMTSQQTLANQVLPFTFIGNIQIPSNCESKLILGNINIYGSLTPNDEVTLLGNHSFTITADLADLLNFTSQQTNTENTNNLLADHQPEEDDHIAENPVPLGLELFNLVKTPTLSKFRSLKPAGNLTLPPRIQAVIINDRVSPQLPKLPRVHKSMIAGNSGLVDSLNSVDQVRKTSQIKPINLDKLAIKPVKTSFPFLKRLKPESSIEKTLSIVENIPGLAVSYEEQDITNLENIPALAVTYEEQDVTNYDITNTNDMSAIIPLVTEDLIEESITVNSPENSPLIKKWMAKQGFLLDEGIELVYQDQNQAQNQEDEQLKQEVSVNENNEKLGEVTDEELVNDLHFNADLESETMPMLDLPEHLRLDNTETTSKPKPQINKPTRLSEEIVLDEDIILIDEEENESKVTELENSLSQQWEFLPTPQLFLPSGELLAGASVKLRLEMPTASSTVIIKLWVEDYQTRALLDGPHLVENLRPTPWGSWEANTQILVPLGCVEILVGAIALDLNSQQESHKVTMVKTVIPPDLSTIEVDEVLGL